MEKRDLDSNEEKDPGGNPTTQADPSVAPFNPSNYTLLANSRERNINEDDVNKLNQTIEENTIMENRVDEINRKNDNGGLIDKMNDIWKSTLIPAISQVPQITFVYKIIFATFIYLLLTYVLDKMLFFYDLTTEIGYVYYVWITILIFFFIILPVKSVYFDYLN